jgi:hypothetical protein
MFYIYKITSNSVVDFAAEELKKYLRMMMPESGDVKISYDPTAECGFRLGLMQDFSLDVSDAADPELDDILYADCDGQGGIIAGDNPRSVLLAVYEYLRKNGCRWLFPGIDGEYIPMKDVSPVKYRHVANMRYRGHCIEGSVSQQILNDFVDFMPKVGLNTFMLQFRVPEVFYERFFGKSDRVNLRENEIVNDNTILAWTRLTECEMAKRGIMLHSYGHGFTADPFCNTPRHSGWGTSDISVIPEGKRDFLAMVNGKREFIIGRPNNTNFCMSNPEARREVVNYIAGYAEKHSNTDFLHVWLADGMNNHCECENCAKMRPSDFYVVLMNELDEELTKRRLNTRIVFIVYVDTSWAPEHEVIKNPDRFTLMLAPITRDYNFTLKGDEEVELLPYVRNNLSMPRNLAEYLAYFDEWKKNWSGANVCFEYHFWRPMNADLSGIKIAERAFEDVRLYKSRGFDGIINCGTQRCFFPHGLAFYTFARSLFDGELSFDEICDDYFTTAFGVGSDEFKAELSALEEAFPYSHFYKIYSNENFYSPEIAEKIKGIPTVVDALLESVKKYYIPEERIQNVSVRMLEYYAEYAQKISEIGVAKALGNNDEARRIFEEFLPRYVTFELYFMNYVDMHQSVRVMRELVACRSDKNGDGASEITVI